MPMSPCSTSLPGAALQRVAAAAAAEQRVVAALAAQHVVDRVAVDHVGEAVAGSVDAGGQRQEVLLEVEVLDVGGQRVDRGARMNAVGALAGGFVHRVAGDVHAVVVVAAIAPQVVHAAGTVQHIRRAVAIQPVGRGVAGQVHFQDAGECRAVPDFGLQRAADAGQEVLAHGVAGVVDDVGVVAVAAFHVIGADAAVEVVVAVVADQPVAAGQAVDVVVGCVGSDQGVVAEVASECGHVESPARPAEGRGGFSLPRSATG